MADETPKPFDPRHPAASAFAPLQPSAGVVSDDADAKGQNLAGGPTATEASALYADQKEVLSAKAEQDIQEKAELEAGETPEDPKPTPPAKKAAAKKPTSES